MLTQDMFILYPQIIWLDSHQKKGVYVSFSYICVVCSSAAFSLVPDYGACHFFWCLSLLLVPRLNTSLPNKIEHGAQEQAKLPSILLNNGTVLRALDVL